MRAMPDTTRPYDRVEFQQSIGEKPVTCTRLAFQVKDTCVPRRLTRILQFLTREQVWFEHRGDGFYALLLPLQANTLQHINHVLEQTYGDAVDQVSWDKMVLDTNKPAEPRVDCPLEYVGWAFRLKSIYKGSQVTELLQQLGDRGAWIKHHDKVGVYEIRVPIAFCEVGPFHQVISTKHWAENVENSEFNHLSSPPACLESGNR